MSRHLLWVLCGVLAGCQPVWTYANVLEPLRERLDTDENGIVGAGEYRAVAYRAPDFTVADTDGNGDLSHAEIWNLVLSQPPATFDGTAPMAEPTSMDMSAYFVSDYEERVLADLMNFLREEVAIRAPGAALPTRRMIALAARSKRLDAPAVVEVLRQLRALHEEVGLRFPPKIAANLDATPEATGEIETEEAGDAE